MNQTSGIELALLEGMDEELLVRLHELGVRTRDELGARIATPESRRVLAERAQVAPVRLEAIHHLNFVLPEERAARLLRLERRVDERVEELRREQRVLGRMLLGLSLALVAAFVIGGVLLRPAGQEPERTDARVQIERLESRLDALAPLARKQAEADLHLALSKLGPAPAWTGPLDWSADDDRRLAVNLGDSIDTLPTRAVSLALGLLAGIENDDTLSVAARASAAAGLLAEFPPVGEPRTLWDAAAAAVRLRLHARAQGLAPLEELAADLFTTSPWVWTDPGFQQSELLLARLETLPVQADALPVWSESVMALRRAANDARDRMGNRSEAWAREYWLRRAELEMAVVAAMVGKTRMLPYLEDSPAGLLARRANYLARTRDKAPPSAKGPLTWLLIEYEEARRLVAWLEGAPGRCDRAMGKAWVDALVALEVRRFQEERPSAAPYETMLAEALRASAVFGATDPSRHSRTSWEAGLRPLLMETRALAARQPPPATTPGSEAAGQ